MMEVFHNCYSTYKCSFSNFVFEYQSIESVKVGLLTEMLIQQTLKSHPAIISQTKIVNWLHEYHIIAEFTK